MFVLTLSVSLFNPPPLSWPAGGVNARGPPPSTNQVVSNPIFRNTPIFLFLNKKDIFETMVEKTPLTVCFPDFPGPEKDVHAALKFLEAQYAKASCSLFYGGLLLLLFVVIRSNCC